MKRAVFLLSSFLLLSSAAFSVHAQEKVFQFGIKAGLNFSNMKTVHELARKDFLKSYTGFNAGMAFKFNLPLGFELQPELLYVQQGFKVDNGGFVTDLTDNVMRAGSLRLPVNVQWGFRFLKIFKPYVLFSPYVGCALFHNGEILDKDFDISDLDRFEYGVGVGAGIDIWRIQLSFKWNWDLNPFFKEGGFKQEGALAELRKSKMNGGELSLVFLF